MASKNISNEIICKHSKDCSSYSAWVRDGEMNKCRSCKNNQYQNPNKVKQDYYKADTPTVIANIIITVIICAFVLWFIYWGIKVTL